MGTGFCTLTAESVRREPRTEVGEAKAAERVLPWGRLLPGEEDPGSASAAQFRGVTGQGSASTFAQCAPWALAPPYARHLSLMGPEVFRSHILAAGFHGSKASTCLRPYSCLRALPGLWHNVQDPPPGDVSGK